MGKSAYLPRGWLMGVLLTIGLAWLASAAWTQARAGERPVTLAGEGLVLVGLAILAHQAFTNENYRRSTATLVGNVLVLIGLIVLGVMRAIAG